MNARSCRWLLLALLCAPGAMAQTPNKAVDAAAKKGGKKKAAKKGEKKKADQKKSGKKKADKKQDTSGKLPAVDGMDYGMAGAHTEVDGLDPKLPLDKDTRLRIFKQARTRKAELERLEGQAKRREKRLESLQADVETRYKALVLMQEELTALTGEDEEAEATDSAQKAAETERRLKQVKRLAQDVEKMKPKDAASMFKAMDEQLVVDVLSRLKPRQAGKILNALPPATGARFSELMVDGKAKRRRRGGR